MAVEQLTTRAFRVIPEGLRHRIVTGWANEAKFFDKLVEEFKCAPNFDLHPAKQEEVKGVLFAAQDGYLINQLRNGQINLHFTVEDILKRKDLVETKTGIGIFRFWGT